MINLWMIIGCHRGSSPEHIKAAFHGRASLLHPDKGGNAAKFAELSEAWSILQSKEKTRIYVEMCKLRHCIPCDKCDGHGFHRMSKGLTEVVMIACERCYGGGFQMEE